MPPTDFSKFTLPARVAGVYAVGATLFPHNIGLGAMRDPDLIEKIGKGL